MKATTILACVFPVMTGILGSVAGYSAGWQEMKAKVVYKLYHPFEAEYLRISELQVGAVEPGKWHIEDLGKPYKCPTNDIENPCPELLDLEEKVREFRRQQSLFPIDPMKEVRTLERLTKLGR